MRSTSSSPRMHFQSSRSGHERYDAGKAARQVLRLIERVQRDTPEQVEGLRRALKAIFEPSSESRTRVELDMTTVEPTACHLLDAAVVSAIVPRYEGKDVLLRLPSHLDQVPCWLWCVPDLIELSAPAYQSPVAVLQGLNRLSSVVLNQRRHDRITIYHSGSWGMRVSADGTELDGVDWQVKEDPDEGLDDDSCEEAPTADDALFAACVDSDSDAEDSGPDGQVPDCADVPASCKLLAERAASARVDWRVRELALHASMAERREPLRTDPFVTIRMGQGIVATNSLVVTTTALSSCCFMSGVNRVTGKAGAYHYPASMLHDQWVLDTMGSWIEALAPDHMVLMFMLPTTFSEGDTYAARDDEALRQWVEQKSGVAVEWGRCAVPAMAFRDGRFEVGTLSALVKGGLNFVDGVDMHGIPSGAHAGDRTSEPILLFGTSMESS